MVTGRAVVAALVVVGAVVGTAGAVSVLTADQRVVLGEHSVTGSEKYSIDRREAVYNGSAIGGYDVTIRNDLSTDLRVNVTVELRDLDGNVVEAESREATVATTATIRIPFDGSYRPGEFGWVHVSAEKL